MAIFYEHIKGLAKQDSIEENKIYTSINFTRHSNEATTVKQNNYPEIVISTKDSADNLVDEDKFQYSLGQIVTTQGDIQTINKDLIINKTVRIGDQATDVKNPIADEVATVLLAVGNDDTEKIVTTNTSTHIYSNVLIKGLNADGALIVDGVVKLQGNTDIGTNTTDKTLYVYGDTKIKKNLLIADNVSKEADEQITIDATQSLVCEKDISLISGTLGFGALTTENTYPYYIQVSNGAAKIGSLQSQTFTNTGLLINNGNLINNGAMSVSTWSLNRGSADNEFVSSNSAQFIIKNRKFTQSSTDLPDVDIFKIDMSQDNYTGVLKDKTDWKTATLSFLGDSTFTGNTIIQEGNFSIINQENKGNFIITTDATDSNATFFEIANDKTTIKQPVSITGNTIINGEFSIPETASTDRFLINAKGVAINSACTVNNSVLKVTTVDDKTSAISTTEITGKKITTTDLECGPIVCTSLSAGTGAITGGTIQGTITGLTSSSMVAPFTITSGDKTILTVNKDGTIIIDGNLTVTGQVNAGTVQLTDN